MTQANTQELFHTTSLAPLKTGKLWVHQYAENAKSKTKSVASSHLMEFLTRVFSSEGASRFFKIFLLRFLVDGSKSSGEDGLVTPSLVSLH